MLIKEVTAKLGVLANVGAGEQAAPAVQTLLCRATAVKRNCSSAARADDDLGRDQSQMLVPLSQAYDGCSSG